MVWIKRTLILALLLMAMPPIWLWANNPEDEQWFANDYKLITTVEPLPVNLKQGVERFLNGPLSMADPGQAFEEDDVMDSALNLPKRRLIFAGVSDKYSFIYYAHGGFVRNDCLIFVENNHKPPRVVFTGIFFNGPAQSVEELRAFLRRDWFYKVKTDDPQARNNF